MNLCDRVYIRKDYPELGVDLGTIGVIAAIHNGGEGYSVEIVSAEGRILAFIVDKAEFFSLCAPHRFYVQFSGTGNREANEVGHHREFAVATCVSNVLVTTS